MITITREDSQAGTFWHVIREDGPEWAPLATCTSPEEADVIAQTAAILECLPLATTQEI